MKHPSARQIVLLLAPPLLLLATYLSFQKLVRRFGPKRGYLGGFLVYWIGWCLLLPLWVLGPSQLRELFRDRHPRLGRPRWLGLLCLGLPLLLGYGYEFPRVLRKVQGATVFLLSGILALVNGTLEEVLWRGTYLRVFPDSWLLGTLYPTLGFAVWHFAPQSVFPNPRPGGNLLLVVVAGVMGLLWGWVAKRTRSIRWTVVSHVLFDYSGLGARIYL